jgi:hypothetical protein
MTPTKVIEALKYLPRLAILRPFLVKEWLRLKNKSTVGHDWVIESMAADGNDDDRSSALGGEDTLNELQNNLSPDEQCYLEFIVEGDLHKQLQQSPTAQQQHKKNNVMMMKRHDDDRGGDVGPLHNGQLDGAWVKKLEDWIEQSTLTLRMSRSATELHKHLLLLLYW